jgi:hypothetical protein
VFEDQRRGVRAGRLFRGPPGPPEAFAKVEEPVRVDRCNNIGDFRSMARRRLPGPIFHYIDGAADDEVTYRRNTEAYERCDLVPNVLAGVESIDATSPRSFDHLVGGSEQRRQNSQSKCLCGLEIHSRFVFGRRLHG